MTRDRERRRDAVGVQDIERILIGRYIRRGWAGCNGRRIIAGDIRYDQCGHARLGQRRKAATLNQRKMFADDIHFLNRRTAMQQLPRDRFQVRHVDAFRRQRQQTGTSAGYQHQEQIVLKQRTRFREYFLRGVLARIIRHGMAGFDHADAF